MNKNKIGFIFILLILSTLLFGQHKEDVIYLKNGSIIRGNIIEFLPGETVKIETVCRNTWVFDADEVLKIVKEDVLTESEGDLEAYLNKKYNIIIDGAVLIGEGNTPVDIPTSIHIINSYKVKPWFLNGIGLGVEFFEQKVIPVFYDVRFVLIQNNVLPYIGIKCGYSVPFTSYTGWFNGGDGYGKGGILFEPGLGISKIKKNGNTVNFSFSYRYQRLNYHKYAGWSSYESDILVNYNRLALRFGFGF